MKTQNRGPLSGIKVLDLGRVLSGPYCGMMLADMGADVIKLEMPETGDDSRYYGPFHEGASAYFSSVNRNKRSITLNLKSESGREIFLKLAEKSDVILENFRPGTMKKLGLDYEQVKKVNPKIIYASISGFGQTGPFAGRAAYDGIVQAMGGIMSITGEKGGKPVKVGTSVGDIIAGMFCAYGIVAAYVSLQKTGKGQYIDVAMLDSQIAILENVIVKYTVAGIIPRPNGNTHTSIFPFETFETETEDIMIAAGNNNLWQKLCHVIGRDELGTDPRFATNPDRDRNHDEMFSIVNDRLKTRGCDEWSRMLDEAGVPCSRINTIDKVLEIEQLHERDMFVTVEHPKAGKQILAGVPVKMSETPGSIYRLAPELGENNLEVYGGILGISEEKMESYKVKGII